MAVIDLDAVRDRTRLARDWLDRTIRDINHPDVVPPPVLEHFAHDVPALIAEVEHLQGVRDALARERDWLAVRRRHALQVRDALIQAAQEHLNEVIYMVDVNEDVSGDPTSVIVADDQEPPGR